MNLVAQVVARTLFGLVVAAVVYGITNSVGWALVGLLAAGVVLNMVVRPSGRFRGRQ